MKPYEEAFPVGSEVRIVDQQALESFAQTWKYHHRLTPEQLHYAGTVAKVENVGFYHGGDPLYEIDGVPGIWHEACLESAASKYTDMHDEA